jgi:GTP-binding protein
MATITSASFVKSANQNEYCPEMDRPEYAFIGRSNVGKSTLINTMCNRKQLAKTSDKPGKTVLMNYFAVESTHEDTSKHARYIVDLPGYGYAKVSKDKRANR